MEAILDMPPKKKPKPQRTEAGVPEGGEQPNYGTGVVKITPELAFKLKMIADFRGSSIADLLEPHIRPLVESMYAVMVKDAQALTQKKG